MYINIIFQIFPQLLISLQMCWGLVKDKLDFKLAAVHLSDICSTRGFAAR